MEKTSRLIESANHAQVDALWAILKYEGKCGIKRKLESMSYVLGVPEDFLVSEAPKDATGRILDKEARHAIHAPLLSRSKNIEKHN